MQAVVKIAKIGKDIRSTDPNDFVFDSDYNTFKIIEEGTLEVTLSATTADQSFTKSHFIFNYIPLVHAFAKREGVDQVFSPNGVDIETTSSITLATTGFTGDITFNYVETNATQLIFNFDNDGGEKNVSIRYFILEAI